MLHTVSKQIPSLWIVLLMMAIKTIQIQILFMGLALISMQFGS